MYLCARVVALQKMFLDCPEDRENILIIVCFIVLKYMRTYYYKYPYFKKNSFGVSLVIRGEEEKVVDEASSEIFNFIKSKKGKPKIF